MYGPARLSEVFVELADTLVEEFDVLELHQLLTERCVELLHVDAAGLMLADEHGELQLMAGASDGSRTVEVFELQIEEGPSRDCFVDGRPLVNITLQHAYHLWPRFTPVALQAGFRVTHAIPMRLRRQMIGVLNLFTYADVHLDLEELAVGQGLADVATIGLVHERNLREQTVLAEQLQSALQTRVLIEQAKGALAGRAGITIAEAFKRMRNHARRRGVTLTSVASAVVDGTLELRTPVNS